MKSIFIVDATLGEVNEEGKFEPSEDGKRINAFSSERTLFDFIAQIVDTKYEERNARIDRITRHEHNGPVKEVTLTFADGNIQMNVGEDILNEAPSIVLDGDLEIDSGLEEPSIPEEKPEEEKVEE